MTKWSVSLVVLCFLAPGGGALAQPAAAPAPLGPLGVPVGATGGLNDAPQIFAANCASCHGNDLTGGRGPSLFTPSLLAENSDEALRQIILNGVSGSEMPAFKGRLDDAQIGRMLAFLRIHSGELASQPPAVPDPTNRVIKSEKETFRIDVVASGIDTPWGEAFLPDGRLLVTERTGHIRIVDANGKLEAAPVKGTPVPWVRQDGGFFDIAVDPNGDHPWVYLSYSEVLPGYKGPLPPPGPLKNGADLPPSMTRIVRAHINADDEWVDQQDIFKAPDRLYTPSVIHYGSRFLFDHKGHLFFTLGDRGDMTNAQRLDTPLGKIHRVNNDGSIPADNPFLGTRDAVPSIWSYGHRNSEGLSIDPTTGILWESEHGPTGGDEINIIEKGHNYGWGVVSMGLQPGINRQHEQGMDDPVTYYSPAIGPSGIAFNSGSNYPGWKNNLFLAALVGQKLFRYEIAGRKIVQQEILWDQYGRTRDVIMGPDGLLYVLLQNATGAPMSTDAATPGMVVRLKPVDN
ncbi:MAG TPA: PQQ-dependent sugar dehydrogenase [Rhizomicrobium sp.]|nr:PQQ-dependent sugar dehydrogenase [Rhizomicrobium sp.]